MFTASIAETSGEGSEFRTKHTVGYRYLLSEYQQEVSPIKPDMVQSNGLGCFAVMHSSASHYASSTRCSD
jgi:hypothetical protein